MAQNLYSTNYTNTLEQITEKYTKLRNLWSLKFIRDKIACYETLQDALPKNKKQKN